MLEFLEKLGKSADLRLDRIDFSSLLDNDDFDPEVSRAILNKDPGALALILKARSRIVCSLAPARDDDDEYEYETDDNDSDNDNDNDNGDESNEGTEAKLMYLDKVVGE